MGAVASQFLIVALVVYLLLFRRRYPKIAEFFAKHVLIFSFAVALGSTIASLFYSEVAGFPPCVLCWYQRIFMYPLTVILGIAMATKDSRVGKYVLPFAFFGFLFALYHNYISYGGTNIFCSGIGDVSCLKRYVFEFGYVTIPIMSLTAFALIIIFFAISGFHLRIKSANESRSGAPT